MAKRLTSNTVAEERRKARLEGRGLLVAYYHLQKHHRQE